MTDESADLLLDRVADGHDAAPRSIALTSPKTGATAIASAAALGPAAAGWVVSTRQMNGMDMGVATGLGSLAFFIVLWVWMMAAMMLPGAAPVLVRRARATSRVLAVPLFVGSYLARVSENRGKSGLFSLVSQGAGGGFRVLPISAPGGVAGEAEDGGELVLDGAGFGEHAVGFGPAAVAVVEQDGLADAGELVQ
jgi:hypothetical protein